VTFFTGAIYPISCDHNSKDVMNLKSAFREYLSHDKYHCRASTRFVCILTVSPSLLVTSSRLGVQTACDIPGTTADLMLILQKYTVSMSLCLDKVRFYHSCNIDYIQKLVSVCGQNVWDMP